MAARDTSEAQGEREVVSISSMLTLCFHEINTILGLIDERDGRSELIHTVQDELGRLRVWAGGFGAHRKPTDRLSLDHRLREAEELHQEVRSHLSDIWTSAQNVHALLRGNEESTSTEDASLSDSSDDDGFWDALKSEEGPSEIEELLLDVNHTISSLYKFSLTLQNPAHRDRSKQAARIDMSHYYVHDIRHVADKFGLSTESPLAQRLGKANTKRRQLLAYNRDHSERISKYVDIVSERAVDRESRSTSSAPKDATSSQWTQDTTASTIRPIDFEVPSDAGRTRFSSTSSTRDDQRKLLIIPLPPEYEKASQNVPFMCPYCYQWIQLENFEDDWEYHVYSDLRPYICTFGNCAQASRLYDSYTEWSEHEWQFHRREWACHICPNIFSSGGEFRAHLRDDHAGSIPENQLDMISQLSGRPVTSPQQCCLCNKAPVGDLGRFQRHLAHHLRQLSLFVLPNPEYEDTDGGSETDCERGLDDIDSRNAILSNSGSRRSVSSWEHDEETNEVMLEAHHASGLAATPTQGAAGDSGEESKSSAPGLRRDDLRVTPANDPGVGYNIERLADEVAQLEVNTESNKSHTAIYYTGFTLFISELPDQKATWANAERTPMKMSHAQLEDLVQKRAKEVSAANQYESLSPEQRAAVDELIKELQSDFGICTFAYIKVYQNIDPQDDYFDTPCMEVILSRQLETSLHDDQVGPGKAGSHPVSQVPRPPPDPKSPEGTYKKQHNMSSFGTYYLYICCQCHDGPKVYNVQPQCINCLHSACSNCTYVK